MISEVPRNHEAIRFLGDALRGLTHALLSTTLPFLAIHAFSTLALAETVRANPQTYASLLRRLQPGDVLQLEPGRYEQGLRIHDLHGTPGSPIVVRGPRDGDPAIFVAHGGRNTVSIANASHVEIRDLVLDGLGLEVDAVKAEHSQTLVHHITLENLAIVRHGPDQQTVGISTQAPASFWTIRNNVIVGAGTGLYLGGSDGTAPFVAGVIEGNLVVDSTGYNLQIKHQAPRPNLEGLGDSPSRTIIRGNVFAKSPGTGTGPMARPNVLLGHLPLQGPGAEDEYFVEENVFYGNPTETLLQAEGNLSLQGNLFLNPVGDGVSIQPHHDVPRRVQIRGNFVAVKGFGLRLSGAHPGYSQVVEQNALYAATPLAGVGGGNATGPTEDAAAALRSWLKAERFTRQDEGFSRLPRTLRSACSLQEIRGARVQPFSVIAPGDTVCIALQRSMH